MRYEYVEPKENALAKQKESDAARGEWRSSAGLPGRCLKRGAGAVENWDRVTDTAVLPWRTVHLWRRWRLIFGGSSFDEARPVGAAESGAGVWFCVRAAGGQA